MAVDTLMFKLEGVQQATELSSIVGKSFTVGKVTNVTNGLGTGLAKWLFLVPSGEAASSAVAVKIEGGRQTATHLAGLVGKTVTVGQAPTVVGGTGNWLVLKAGSGAAVGATAAVATKGGASSKLFLMQLEGTQQIAQMKTIAGKTFTVIPSPMVGGTAKGWLFMKPLGDAAVAGKDLVALQVQGGTQANLAGLVGKSFTLAKAPMATGNATGSWILLKPAVGVTKAVGTAGGVAVVAKGGGATLLPDGWQEFAAKATGTAKTTPLATKALATTGSTAGGAAVATAAKGGTIWQGTGLSLGMGMGLGVWGPVMLTGFIAAVGYGAYRYYRNRQALEAEGELVEVEAG